MSTAKDDYEAAKRAADLSYAAWEAACAACAHVNTSEEQDAAYDRKAEAWDTYQAADQAADAALDRLEEAEADERRMRERGVDEHGRCTIKRVFRRGCPVCCTTTSLHRSEDEHGPTWECSCCYRRWERRVQKAGEHQTESQKDTLRRLRAQMLHSFVTSGEAEVKTEEAEMRRGLLFVRLEVGDKGDEGTLASVFCRTRVHVQIGRGGAVRPVYWTGPKNKEPRTVFDVVNRGTDWDKCWMNPAKKGRQA